MDKRKVTGAEFYFFTGVLSLTLSLKSDTNMNLQKLSVMGRIFEQITVSLNSEFSLSGYCTTAY